MKELDAIYRKILTAGLISVRDAAQAGDLQRCRAEAEHLHNLPSLIGEENRQRHLYYVSSERTAYLEWVRSTGRTDLKEFVFIAYIPHWKRMDELLGVDKIIGDREE